ncbi:myelin protein zero like 3 [Phyllostomus discolor]|uniref:Myelin protein zero like 3 n=1 Tax=Phyllostomus discolor TaxID=89673 RepID=A0A834A5I0_9CHIR|nr:myelin protein zero like 3 [Phyllostomus discolor]
MRQRGAARGHGCILLPLVGVLFFQRVYTALSLEIKVDAHVRGYVGEKIKLKCIFKSTSSVTDKLTIDWTYRPPSSSRTESVLAPCSPLWHFFPFLFSFPQLWWWFCCW